MRQQRAIKRFSTRQWATKEAHSHFGARARTDGSKSRMDSLSLQRQHGRILRGSGNDRGIRTGAGLP